MLQCECGSVSGPHGQEEACIPHEVAGMSITINKATVLDEAFIHTFVQSVA